MPGEALPCAPPRALAEQAWNRRAAEDVREAAGEGVAIVVRDVKRMRSHHGRFPPTPFARDVPPPLSVPSREVRAHAGTRHARSLGNSYRKGCTHSPAT